MKSLRNGFIGHLAMIITMVIVCGSTVSVDAANGLASVDSSASQSSDYFAAISYDDYLKTVDNKNFPDQAIKINAADTASKENCVVADKGKYGTGEDVLYSYGASGSASWNFEVGQAGMYQLSFSYFPVPGNGATAERGLLLDGQIPYAESRYISFPSTWTNDENNMILAEDRYVFRRDILGNEIAPIQKEVSLLSAYSVTDQSGYHDGPLYFYLTEGSHTIRLSNERGDLALLNILISNTPEPASSGDIRNSHPEAADYTGEPVIIQGEAASLKSDPVFIPNADRSSPLSEPSSSREIVLNTIGGSQWSQQGQWIEWQADVPQSGFYRFGMRARQNLNSGISSTRKLFIDGQLPFKEAQDITIRFSNNWQIVTLGKNGQNLLYLEKGKHKIRLEVSFGQSAQLMNSGMQSILKLNEAYREILALTGRTPDTFRDYHIDKLMPDVITVFEEQSKALEDLSRNIVRLSGTRGSTTTILDNLSAQLNEFVDKPTKISKQLTDYRNNISSLGSWILAVSEQPLEIDYLFLNSPAQPLPKAEGNFIQRTVFEISNLIGSFFEDYSKIGSTNQESEATLNIFMQSSRAQAQIVKNLADSSFTPDAHINVTLKVASTSSTAFSYSQLLMSIASGIAPDISLMIRNSDVLNYAARGAVSNLKNFTDYGSVITRFQDNSMIPFEYTGGSYALPETQVFLVMFYRKDILSQMGISLPKTWDELTGVIGTLGQKNLQVGIMGGNADNDMLFYGTLLKQKGASLYSENQKQSGLSSKAAIESFTLWTSFFTAYSCPIDYDPVTRFRLGEMPIFIADYSQSNNISVIAPEISGLWDFTEIPGTLKDNGQIDNSSTMDGLCSMIMQQSKQKAESWAFLKWWTSAETQKKYGQYLQNLYGTAARYTTANVQALNQLPWGNRQLAVLNSQWLKSSPNPEIPGSFYTGRYIENALRYVLNNHSNPGETLLDYSEEIQKEITSKRLEFGLED